MGTLRCAALPLVLVSLVACGGAAEPTGRDAVATDDAPESEVAPDTQPPAGHDAPDAADLPPDPGTEAFDVPPDTAGDAFDVAQDACEPGGDCPPYNVRFVTPTDGGTVHGIVALEATATDDMGLAKIAFYVDDALVGTAEDAPYRLDWDSTGVANGPYRIKATAHDTAGATAEASISVVVANCSPVVFFDAAQVAIDLTAGVTSDTVSSEGYRFTYTRDKLFTGGVGMTEPIGRAVRVPWPEGVEAQAVTTGPVGDAKIIIERIDGGTFALVGFTARLLGNTAATGASFEIMPKLNGEDGLADPLFFDASGYYGIEFSYDTSTNILGSTALLKGFDSYTIGVFVDFALTALILDACPPSSRPMP